MFQGGPHTPTSVPPGIPFCSLYPTANPINILSYPSYSANAGPSNIKGAHGSPDNDDADNDDNDIEYPIVSKNS